MTLLRVARYTSIAAAISFLLLFPTGGMSSQGPRGMLGAWDLVVFFILISATPVLFITWYIRLILSRRKP